MSVSVIHAGSFSGTLPLDMVGSVPGLAGGVPGMSHVTDALSQHFSLVGVDLVAGLSELALVPEGHPAPTDPDALVAAPAPT